MISTKYKIGDKLKYVGRKCSILTPGKIYSISKITNDLANDPKYWFKHDDGELYWISNHHSENYVFLEDNTKSTINFLDLLKEY
jgi:hypothetical protein